MGEIADALEIGAQSAQLELLEDWDQVERFIYAGRAIFTLRSRKTGRDYTYKITKGTYVYFAAVEKGGYMLFDTIGRISKHRHTGTIELKGATGGEAAKGLLWFLTALDDRRTDLLDQIEFKHLGRCGRCGRPLTDSESIDRGIGPDCWSKMEN